MVTCDQQEKVASTPKVLLGNFLQIQRYAEGMLNQTVYERVGNKFPFYEPASRNWARALEANCCDMTRYKTKTITTM